jgi:DNA-binding CsgD family transcriptional regulator
VEDYSARAWYLLSGLEQVLGFAVLVAAIHFFTGVYRVRYRWAITIGFVMLMLACALLLFSPIGAVLDEAARTIRFGVGYKITAVCYFAAFTFMLAVGYGGIRRLWDTERRNFLIGLLVFATVGYLEPTISLPRGLREPAFTISNDASFLFSSIPYALYGVFLIVYFLESPVPAPLASLAMEDLPEAFLTRYGITGREREIILKVVQGKSNADIAAELFISLATVKTHLHNIYKKIGVDSRYDLLARVRSGQ